MKMTNYLRAAFVNAAMDDVPNVDYGDQLQSLVNKHVAKALKAANIVNVEPMRLCNNYEYIANCSYSMNGLTNEESEAICNTPEILETIAKYNEQVEKRAVLRRNLTSAIGACTTRKQAVKALPEFEKYLPADTPAALRSLPVLDNVVSDFVKAGWPKNQKRIKAVAA